MTPEEFQVRCDEMRNRLSAERHVTRKVRACPRCDGENTTRKGIAASGKQMHFCRDCDRYFTGSVVNRSARESVNSGLMCYWCGSADCIHQGSPASGGKSGHCQRCRKYFTQGGRLDLERYHLLLSDRIARLNLPADVALELFQTASLDVLTGAGYCWTVHLNVKRAWKTSRGEFGQRGSDHPVYRMHNGQRVLASD